MLKSHYDLSTKPDAEPEEDAQKKPKAKRERKKKVYQEELGMEGEEKSMEGEMGMEEMMGEADYVKPEEPEPEYPLRRLKSAEISINMSLLGKTAEGDGFTYLKATINGRGLTEISAIKSFKHLQFLDLSDNLLNSKALQAVTELPFLVLLKADQNVLKSAALCRMKFLQVIIMNKNLIQSVEDIYQPELSTLELGENKITKLLFKNRMPNLRCLDLRNNMVKELTELNFPHLDSLYMAGNKIKYLDGIERLVNLRILHLRYNPLKHLAGFTEDLTKLKYLNLRNCKVSSLIQVKKLRVLPALTTLVLTGCPYMGGTGEEDGAKGGEDDPETRIATLAALPKLTRFNKARVTDEEQAEARELMLTWMEEGEKDEEEVEEEQLEEPQ